MGLSISALLSVTFKHDCAAMRASAHPNSIEKFLMPFQRASALQLLASAAHGLDDWPCAPAAHGHQACLRGHASKLPFFRP